MAKICVARLMEAITRRQRVVNESAITNWQKAYGIDRIATLDKADEFSVAFLSNAKYTSLLKTTQAGVVLVDEANLPFVPDTAIALVVKSPYLAYACVSQLFETVKFDNIHQNAIHQSAIIASTALIGQNVCVGAYVSIGERVSIGDNVRIAANTVIDEGAVIGTGSSIGSGVVIAPHCVIGESCYIYAGACIGSDGFGFAPSDIGWERIAQLGRVVIGNNVRIGANTCIDRGAIDDTVIGDDVIIDNLVQIAHNVVIGKRVAIAAGVGIAGSTTIGNDCIIGGMAGIVGHLTIADGTVITAMTLVSKSITTKGTYSGGITAMPSQNWRRAVVGFRQLGKSV